MDYMVYFKEFIICSLFLGCAANIPNISEGNINDAGIDSSDIIETMPPYENKKPNKPNTCEAEGIYKGPIYIPIECKTGPKKFLEIPELIDPAPEVMGK